MQTYRIEDGGSVEFLPVLGAQAQPPFFWVNLEHWDEKSAESCTCTELNESIAFYPERTHLRFRKGSPRFMRCVYMGSMAV